MCQINVTVQVCHGVELRSVVIMCKVVICFLTLYMCCTVASGKYILGASPVQISVIS